ncbi:cell division protein FtsJ [Paenibacillus mesophilus]|uniref:cyclic-phosphate processing receiver domain-containing protein n=1 Tax=Paenibacillus mesophilus TaxID=2582849 RepID=UPI00110DDB20|nr:cyclic-phosphate processing receiver domain-containing protein [Paenibacillus mesophilus]TMV50270.1 cell division protein FtsJ [Paenibacillus mesophilus]
MIDLYMDDARPCPKGFVLAKDAAECIVLLRECEVRVLSLDYDLGWNMPNGMEVVRFIVSERIYPSVIYLHTSSAAGKMQMFQSLYANKPEHVRLYNYPMPEQVIRRIAAGNFEVEKGHGPELQ